MRHHRPIASPSILREQIAKLQFYAISNTYTFIPITLGISSRQKGVTHA